MIRISKVGALLLCCVVATACGSGDGVHDSSHDTSTHSMASGPNGAPVNYLVYEDGFSSAGMPDEAFIKTLAARGVKTVINIAPPDASGSLVNEADHVAAAQMTYLNIAVDWNNPTQTDVEQFLNYMKPLDSEEVFLHCQMNMRATAFAMLHRVINQGVDPARALADMNTVWAPNRVWSELVNTALARHGVDFAIPVPSE